MSPDAPGLITIYRASTHMGRARTFHVLIDGTRQGSVRGSQRLEISVAAGEHTVAAGYGSHTSPDLTVDVAAGQPSTVVIDVVPTPEAHDASQNAIRLRETDDVNKKATAKGGTAQLGNTWSCQLRLAPVRRLDSAPANPRVQRDAA